MRALATVQRGRQESNIWQSLWIKKVSTAGLLRHRRIFMGLLNFYHVVIPLVKLHADEPTLAARGDVDDELDLPPLVDRQWAVASVVGDGLRPAGLHHRVTDADQLGALVAVALQPRGQRARAVGWRAAARVAQQRHGGHHGRQAGVLVHLVPERRVRVAEVVLARLVQAVPVAVLRHPRREAAARVRQVGSGQAHDLGALAGGGNARAGGVGRHGHGGGVADVLVDEAAVQVLVRLVRAQLGPAQLAHHVVVGAIPPRRQALQFLHQILGALDVGAGRVPDQQPRGVHARVDARHGRGALARALVVGEGVGRLAERAVHGARLGLLAEHGVQLVVRVHVPAQLLDVGLAVVLARRPPFLVLQHVHVPLVDDHAPVTGLLAVRALVEHDVLVALAGHAVALAVHRRAVDADVEALLEPLAFPVSRERARFSFAVQNPASAGDADDVEDRRQAEQGARPRRRRRRRGSHAGH